MRWNSAKLIKTPHAHTHTERKNTVDEKQKKERFFFLSTTRSTAAYCLSIQLNFIEP